MQQIDMMIQAYEEDTTYRSFRLKNPNHVNPTFPHPTVWVFIKRFDRHAVVVAKCTHTHEQDTRVTASLDIVYPATIDTWSQLTKILHKHGIDRNFAENCRDTQHLLNDLSIPTETVLW